MLGLRQPRVRTRRGRRPGAHARRRAARRARRTATGPTIVCAQAGNVNTGAFDPCDEIVPTCARARRLAPRRRRVRAVGGREPGAAPAGRRASSGADSWATDAHKWLNVPYDSGIVIVRDPEAHRAAMPRHGVLSRADARRRARSAATGCPSSRAARAAFAVYAALRSLGRTGVAELVERCCRLARRMAERLRAGARRAHPERRGAEPGAGALRAGGPRRGRVHQGRDRARAARRHLLARRHALARAAPRCASRSRNWSTDEDDIDRSAAAILRAAREEAK